MKTEKNMVKVLLIDDDFLVCNFLKTIITWEDYGFTIIGQAYNGNDALEKISRLKPELVLLDINMPMLDGIELIRILHDRFPEIKVVMLSNYSDYDYVREAMKLGAVDYLLKHRLSGKELTALLSGMRFTQEGQPEQPRTQTAASGGYAFNAIRDSRTRSFFEKRGTQLPPNLIRITAPVIVAARIRLCIAKTDDGDLRQTAKQEQYMQALLPTCMQVCNQDHDVKIVYMGNFNIIFLFSAHCGESREKQQERALERMNVIHDALLKYHNAYIVWKCGERCEDPSLLPEEYIKLSGALEHPDDRAESYYYCQLSIEQERRIIRSVLNKDKKALHESLREVFEPLVNKGLHQVQLAILAGDMLTLLIKLHNENHLVFNVPDNSEILNLSIERIWTYFEELFINLISLINNNTKYTKQVNAILDYVNQNYSANIGLNDVARHCSLNPSYVSTLFKKETGINLNLYISRTRIYFAGKLMIMDEALPTHVYEHVGFNNYNNFFNTFKSITGMSPACFKKNAGIEWIMDFDPLIARDVH